MPRAGITAERLTLAAADLADERGFDKLTFSALARHFGVKDASLYSHVRNLAELRTRIAVLAGTELAETVGDALAGRSGRAALTAFAHAYRDYALSHPGRYAATQLPVDPEVLAAHPGPLTKIELTYAMLRSYGLTEPDLTDAVRLLRSTLHGFVTLESSGGFNATRPVEASWNRTVQALHTTLENWPKEA
ncbi:MULTISPECIES: TetR/AcrR family transcriptional regulator [Streptomyces]|uniref:Transcriptional regulator n=1 Tax=Streptomyces albus (strain ATCC 21838 / DSM 41398 / FERM P-419 / JCM 4703 / NBRC 107858) TaxID=1081613 RepID=A0A0B5EKD4_STRA4|nr:TetR/AcrR family transcriptional regulator [Streptomyces sp. SCSIO ZS0520]AJE82748.1 transcriptional regulator [Streptomyces albus]AOU77060.1 transcriptional regulator [Streptomyces albus]AYN32838.1 TetR/AcrR family transcriptional regulator [Streptomyces albus]